jgi:hypothetical protein
MSQKLNDFRENVFNIKCRFRFFPQRLPEIFLILRRTERDLIKNVIDLHVKYTSYSCQMLMKYDFFSVDFLKILKCKKFYENPPSGSRFVPCGQTDGRTNGQKEVAKLIVAFRNFANVPKRFLFFAVLLRCTEHTVWAKRRGF